MNPRSATTNDVGMGARLRAARIEKKVSQADAGEVLGVSFQQIQKYEKGVNRVSASRLQELAALYEKPIEWFLERPQMKGATSDLGAAVLATGFGRRLCEAYLAIDEQDERAMLLHMAETLARRTARRLQAAE